MNISPKLFEDLPTPAEMRLWDEAAWLTHKIPSLLLMENAGREAFYELAKHCALSPASKILIFAGKGNNGGDGFVLARHLHDAGCQVLVCSIHPFEALCAVAAEHARIAVSCGVPFLTVGIKNDLFLPLEWRNPDVVADALIGSGMSGSLREEELALINAINEFRGRSMIFAIDIPTGLCGLTGRPMPEAVRADLTVSFEAGCPGLYLPQASKYAGHVAVRKIGIPQAVRASHPASWRLLAPQNGEAFLPNKMLHKGRAGKVLVIGGSPGMAGAPQLAARGALRAGAGLVHIACPRSVEPFVRSNLPEAMTVPLGGHPEKKSSLHEGLREVTDVGDWDESAADDCLRAIETLKPDALVIGPGMGRSRAACLAVKAVLGAQNRPPALVDADALFFFAHPREDSANFTMSGLLDPGLLTGRDIITPHSGEMARLLGPSFFAPETTMSADTTPPQSPDMKKAIRLLEADRPAALKAITARFACTCVLKGPGTLIGHRGGPTILAPFSVAALAVGGSGDVLAGVAAALLAQGNDGVWAASLAVYLHGRAGEILSESSPRGHLAGEIADTIRNVWQELTKE